MEIVQVAVDIDYHRTMFELHQRVNAKEVIIGWYPFPFGSSEILWEADEW